jgi:hypothetical protein
VVQQVGPDGTAQSDISKAFVELCHGSRIEFIFLGSSRPRSVCASAVPAAHGSISSALRDRACMQRPVMDLRPCHDTDSTKTKIVPGRGKVAGAGNAPLSRVGAGRWSCVSILPRDARLARLQVQAVFYRKFHDKRDMHRWAVVHELTSAAVLASLGAQIAVCTIPILFR